VTHHGTAAGAASPSPIIDAHVHVGYWDHPDFLGRGAELDETLVVLRDAGIEGAAILPTDQRDNAGLLASARAAVAAGDATRLWMFAWVRPVAHGAEEAERELSWVREHAGSITGLKIHPSLSRHRVTDAGFAPALELAASLDLMVLVHCGRWQEMASYRFAIEAAARYPQVRFLLAHAGGDTPPLATAAADLVADRRIDNVWFDCSGLREYWVLERNVRVLGADRYLMGSDYSLAHPLMYVGAVRGMNLSDRDRGRILGGNAVELLGPELTA
jgi:predicted TIM-barrel fold metal-dependent hydrolase